MFLPSRSAHVSGGALRKAIFRSISQIPPALHAEGAVCKKESDTNVVKFQRDDKAWPDKKFPPPPPMGSFGGNEYGGSWDIEIPFFALLLMVGSVAFWWFSRDHSLIQNEVSYSLFVEKLLKRGLVERLEVVNSTFVRVILKEGVPIIELLESEQLPVDLEPWSEHPQTCNHHHAEDTRVNETRSSDAHLSDAHSSDAHSTDAHSSDARLSDARLSGRDMQQPQHADAQVEQERMEISAEKHADVPAGDTNGDVKKRKGILPILLPTTRVVCFTIGDVTKLESLLQDTAHLHLLQRIASPKGLFETAANLLGFYGVPETEGLTIPPIFYRDEVDLVQLARAYAPSVALTAATFVTFSKTAVSARHVPPPHIDRSSFFPSPQDKLLKFGKATPVLGKDVPKVRFSDVAGLEQAKKEVSEFVEFLRNPKKFYDLGAEIPKGALLVGPPGTGKTLLAKAVAGEAGVPFYSMSGSDFMEMFVGVGPSRVRDLFDRARKNAPAIIFIDEIDTIGRSRGLAGMTGGGGSDERESTLNALLVELDGFTTTRSGVIILGGTNRGDVLDAALTRPGRFDRQIALAKPSVRERKEIFDIHLKPVKVNVLHEREEVSKRLAALTPGFSGAEIKSVCNEAAILAARRDANSVTLMDLENAVERLIGGLKHTGEVLTADLKKVVALHEAGHAVCGWFMAHADPVLKLSVVPRASGSLGYTQLLPDELLLAPKDEVLAKIAVLLGGRVSEELFADTVTTGASDDLIKATRLAHSFVTQLGFDKHAGLPAYGKDHVSSGIYYSEATAKLIDERVKVILDEQYAVARNLLKSREKEVRAVADLLVEKEVISFADLVVILGPRPGKLPETIRQYVEALPQRLDPTPT